jgi:Outer membrane efflux protein
MQNFRPEATFLTLSSNLVLSAIKGASLREQIVATDRTAEGNAWAAAQGAAGRGAGHIGRYRHPRGGFCTSPEQTLPALESNCSREESYVRHVRTFRWGRTPGTVWILRPAPAERLTRELALGGGPAAAGWLRTCRPHQKPSCRRGQSSCRNRSGGSGHRQPIAAIQFNCQRRDHRSSVVEPGKPILPASAFWALAASASQVLFDGFSRAQRQRAAEAGLDEAAAQYRSTEIGAFRNVADAL